MKKKPKPAAEISHDDVTPPAGTTLEGAEPDESEDAAEKPTGWDANGSEVTTATVAELPNEDAERAARHAALPDTVDLPGVPSTAAERCLSQEERAQIATHGHVLGRGE